MLSGQINFPALSCIHDEGHFLMFNTFTAISLKKPIAQCQAFLLISPPY